MPQVRARFSVGFGLLWTTDSLTKSGCLKSLSLSSDGPSASLPWNITPASNLAFRSHSYGMFRCKKDPDTEADC